VRDSSEIELAALNTNMDAAILDEDAWEEATDESGVDWETLCHSHWRTSALDSGEETDAWFHADDQIIERRSPPQWFSTQLRPPRR
jgi:hypothetical protein